MKRNTPHTNEEAEARELGHYDDNIAHRADPKRPKLSQNRIPDMMDLDQTPQTYHQMETELNTDITIFADGSTRHIHTAQVESAIGVYIVHTAAYNEYLSHHLQIEPDKYEKDYGRTSEPQYHTTTFQPNWKE